VQDFDNGMVIKELAPPEFFLSQNYPNPFSEKTTIKYCVAYKTKVKLTVFDVEGNLIENLVDEEKNPGTYEVEFSTCHSCESLPDGKAGRNPESGTYYYRLEATPIGGQAGDYKSEKRMQILNAGS
jgi:hypothetical protein